MNVHSPAELAFNTLLGARLRQLRQQQGLTCAEVSSLLAEHGATVSRPNITITEQGKRAVTTYELLAFSRVFATSVSVLLDQLPIGEPAKPGHDEATQKAARRLGVTPAEVEAVAHRLWGSGLTAERERRARVAGVATRSRTDQTRRGLITRSLINELCDYWVGKDGRR